MHMANTEKQKRLVMMVSEDFHRKVKIAAAQTGRDMRDVVVECVTNCLESPAALQSLKDKSDQPKP